MNNSTTEPIKTPVGQDTGLSKNAAYKSKPTVNVIQAIAEKLSLEDNKEE